MTLSNDEIIEILNEYVLSPKKQYAVLIDGEWGSGKTYFIKRNYIDKHPDTTLYISLYGLKSKDEINKKIYYEIINKSIKNKKIASTLEKAETIRNNVAKVVNPEKISINSIFKIDLSGLKNIDISGIISLFADLKKYTLIFDDLERCEMPINEALGFINDLVEHKEVKVIIIANENEINKFDYDNNYELKLMSTLNDKIDFNETKKKNISFTEETNEPKLTLSDIKARINYLYEENKQYKAVKEKLIGFTIKYEPDLSSIYDEIISEYEYSNNDLYTFLITHKKDFINIMNVNLCNNVRTVIYIFDIFENLFNKVRLFDDSDIIMNLVFRNTIFCSIGIKNGVKIENILDGCICNISVSLYEDNYNFKYFFTAFDFVNDYISTGKLDECKISKSIAYYKDLDFDNIDKNDPFMKLGKYWLLDNENLITTLNQLNENIKSAKYSYKLTSKIIYYLSRIENLNFQIPLINEILNNLKLQLKSKNITTIDFHELIDNENVSKIYNNHISDFRKLLDLNSDEKNINDIETILESENWGIDLYNYAHNNRWLFLEKKSFLKDLDIKIVLDNIVKTNNNDNIYHLKYSIDTIYRNQNIKKYSLLDKPLVDELLNGLTSIVRDSFSITKNEVIDNLIIDLKEISEKMNE